MPVSPKRPITRSAIGLLLLVGGEHGAICVSELVVAVMAIYSATFGVHRVPITTLFVVGAVRCRFNHLKCRLPRHCHHLCRFVGGSDGSGISNRSVQSAGQHDIKPPLVALLFGFGHFLPCSIMASAAINAATAYRS